MDLYGHDALRSGRRAEGTKKKRLNGSKKEMKGKRVSLKGSTGGAVRRRAEAIKSA